MEEYDSDVTEFDQESVVNISERILIPNVPLDLSQKKKSTTFTSSISFDQNVNCYNLPKQNNIPNLSSNILPNIKPINIQPHKDKPNNHIDLNQSIKELSYQKVPLQGKLKNSKKQCTKNLKPEETSKQRNFATKSNFKDNLEKDVLNTLNMNSETHIHLIKMDELFPVLDGACGQAIDLAKQKHVLKSLNFWE